MRRGFVWCGVVGSDLVLCGVVMLYHVMLCYVTCWDGDLQHPACGGQRSGNSVLEDTLYGVISQQQQTIDALRAQLLCGEGGRPRDGSSRCKIR